VTADRIAVSCGPVSLTETQLRERIERSQGEREIMPGRVVPIIDADRIAALMDAPALRESGGNPLLGDDRWEPRLWAGMRRLADDARPVPGMAWATFNSGSTGTPRVIVRTESSWSASFHAVSGHLQLTDTGVTLADVVAFEIVEAFAAQPLAVLQLLGLAPDGVADPRVCAQGGALALGHSWGASGAVSVVRLFSRLVRGNAPAGTLGIATTVVGGGMGVAAVFEVVR
jgi:hypothetical protein